MLLDVEGASVLKFMKGLRMYARFAVVGIKFFPAIMGSIAIVNGPPLSAWGLKHIKPFLKEADRGRIHLLSGDAVEGLKRYLPLRLIPAELQKQHAATSTPHSPGCQSCKRVAWERMWAMCN